MKIVNNTLDWINVSSGVLKGGSLSPLLFFIFINDLSVSI